MRLVDAKAGKKVFLKIAQPAEYKGVIHMVVPISEIDKLPTVDAVEVVRCKDCKHRYNGVYCTHPQLLSWSWGAIRKCENNDFCSYGERKEGEGNG